MFEVMDSMITDKGKKLLSLLPVGFCFKPTEQELLNYYLRIKIKGASLPWDLIPEYDLYGDRFPWELFPNSPGVTFYAFTKLKKVGKRTVRSVQCGDWEWHGNTLSEIKDARENVIGFKRSFTFKVKKNQKRKRGCDDSSAVSSWIMHEYSLPETETETMSDYVVCQILNKESKNNGEESADLSSAAVSQADVVTPILQQLSSSASSLTTLSSGESAATQLPCVDINIVAPTTHTHKDDSMQTSPEEVTQPQVSVDAVTSLLQLSSSDSVPSLSTPQLQLPSSASSFATSSDQIGMGQTDDNIQTSQEVTQHESFCPSIPELELFSTDLDKFAASTSSNQWEWLDDLLNIDESVAVNCEECDWSAMPQLWQY